MLAVSTLVVDVFTLKMICYKTDDPKKEGGSVSRSKLLSGRVPPSPLPTHLDEF